MAGIYLYSINATVHLNNQNSIRAAMRFIMTQNDYDMIYMRPTRLYGGGGYDYGLDTPGSEELEEVMEEQEDEYRQALLDNFNLKYAADYLFLRSHLHGGAANPITL